MQNSLYNEQSGKRCLVWMVCGYMFGIFCCLNFSFIYGIGFDRLLVYSFVFTAIFAAQILMSFFASGRHCGTALRNFTLAWFVLLGFVFGILRTAAFDSFYCRDLKETAGTENEYTGILTENPQPSSTGKTIGFTVRIMTCGAQDNNRKLNGNIKLYVKPEKCKNLKADDVIAFKTTLNTPEDERFEGGYSRRAALYRNGLAYSAVTDDIEILYGIEKPKDFLYILSRLGFRLQKSIIERIDAAFGEQNAESALLKGLLTGNRDDFNDEQYDNFALSGFIHITAVSGMHIMFLYAAIMFIVRRLRLPRFIGNLIPIPFMIIFMAAAGFTPSVCRAVIMTCLAIMALMLKREPDALTSLAAASALILSVNPYALTSYSFILSFSSVAGIILFASPIYKGENRIIRSFVNSDNKKPVLLRAADGLARSASVSAGAQLGLGYFSARFFGYFSWGSIIGNAFVIPLASVSFISGFAVWLVSFLFSGAAEFIARYPLRLVLRIINGLAAFFSFPVFGIKIPVPPKSAFAVYIIMMYMLYKKLSGRQYKNKTDA